MTTINSLADVLSEEERRVARERESQIYREILDQFQASRRSAVEQHDHLITVFGQTFDAHRMGDCLLAAKLLDDCADAEFDVFGDCERTGKLANELGYETADDEPHEYVKLPSTRVSNP